MSEQEDTFVRTFSLVLGMLVVFMILIIFAARLVAPAVENAADRGRDPMKVAAMLENIEPLGQVAVGEAGAAAPQAARSGKEIFDAVCAACHATGALNAPKLGDQEAWAPRIKQGAKHILEDAINGIRAMPPRGGDPSLTDDDMKAVVGYMLEKVGVKDAYGAPAPKASAAPAPAASADAGKGKQVYEQACFACHGTGAAGAPKLGDKAAWKARIAQGADALNDHALKGLNAMPAKGGRPDLADVDVVAAVDYMVGKSK
ncbi:MAG: cytochrome c5 family protein [Pseudomonadota bacterium]|nr:MAG: cytochrome c5 family protein [Pseudomonadota bacterium]